VTRAATLALVSLLLWGTLWDVACLARLATAGPEAALQALAPRGPGAAFGWLSLALGIAALPGWFALLGGLRRGAGGGPDAGDAGR
jgi:hypothetical protein